MRKLIPLLYLCVLLSAPAYAADENGFFMVKGAGTTKCADFNAALKDIGPELVSYGGWIEGYLSAMNRYENGIYDLSAWRSTELLIAALARFCGQNPEIGFHDAFVGMSQQMHSSAVVNKSPIKVAEGEKGSVVLYAETIRRIQLRLQQRGFFSDEVSGEWNEMTRHSLARFQKRYGLEAHGLPDQMTLARLLH